MRTHALLAFCLAACSGDEVKNLVEVRIATLPEDVSELDLSDARRGEARTYPLEVKSHADVPVTLQARIEDGPKGMAAAVLRESRLLPRPSARPGLQLALPSETGAIRGRVVMYSPDLPGWTRSWTFRGEVVDKPLPGRYLRADPVGVDLGDLRPGETRDFVVALESFGDEDVLVEGWSSDDPERLALATAPRAQAVVPGGRLQLEGRLRAPNAGGPYRAQIRVDSNAQNVRGFLAIVVAGTVVPDYALRPREYGPRVHYPVQENEITVDVEAREGVAPFTVKEVSGHERHFTLVSKGTDAPARSQKVVFRLLRKAPTDVHENQKLKVRLLLEPNEVLDWPVELRLLPPVHPQPDKIHFGEVPPGVAVRREFSLAAFGPRDFDVKSCRSRDKKFLVEPLPRSEGMQWRFWVGLPAGTPPGLYRDVLDIETTDPDVPLVTVQVAAVVKE
mgnify:CR=1 FL=1